MMRCKQTTRGAMKRPQAEPPTREHLGNGRELLLGKDRAVVAKHSIGFAEGHAQLI